MSGCVRVTVPREACYVEFGAGPVRRSRRMNALTVRGDNVVLDFDVNHRLVGIELVGDKPCTKGSDHDH